MTGEAIFQSGFGVELGGDIIPQNHRRRAHFSPLQVNQFEHILLFRQMPQRRRAAGA